MIYIGEWRAGVSLIEEEYKATSFGVRLLERRETKEKKVRGELHKQKTKNELWL